MKTCSKCHLPKGLDEFWKSAQAADGRQNYCKACAKAMRQTPEARLRRKEYDARDYARHTQAHKDRAVARKRLRKRQLVEERGGQCERCGYDKCLTALSFHHRDPATKEFELASTCGSLERLRKEADKCDLLCLNCHALSHCSQGCEHQLGGTHY